MKDMKDKFNNIIGQKSAKKKLEFFIDGYDASGIIPHLMFVAPKGSGKTLMAKQLGRNLVARHDEERLGRPKFLEINCSTPRASSSSLTRSLSPTSTRKNVRFFSTRHLSFPRM